SHAPRQPRIHHYVETGEPALPGHGDGCGEAPARLWFPRTDHVLPLVGAGMLVDRAHRNGGQERPRPFLRRDDCDPARNGAGARETLLRSAYNARAATRRRTRSKTAGLGMETRRLNER